MAGLGSYLVSVIASCSLPKNGVFHVVSVFSIRLRPLDQEAVREPGRPVKPWLGQRPEPEDQG